MKTVEFPCKVASAYQSATSLYKSQAPRSRTTSTPLCKNTEIKINQLFVKVVS